MKTVIIHGQSHKGSTYNIAKLLQEKIGGEYTEFFLPKDFSHFCTGCTACIIKDEKLCPGYDALEPIVKAMDGADLLIFASPVYVCHVTGPMKSFLDHFGYRWMLHRPEEKMFKKQAVCISTAAGGGTKSTNKDISDSLFFWGIPRIYKLGYNVRATAFKDISPELIKKIQKDTEKLAKKINKKNGKTKPGIKTRGLFQISKKLHTLAGWNQADCRYWEEKGWAKNTKPWK